ncbi:hypothetical protein [Salipiger marinus]|uniref:hypothetical protein n=1 Tax=Salipiger marinus TaxID=555512 RepID=UPI000B7D9389|nr:hypothetical protein [Salipiger marinus]
MIDWARVWIFSGVTVLLGTVKILSDGVARYWQPWVVLATYALAFAIMGLFLSFPNDSKAQRNLAILSLALLILAAILPTIFELW